MFAAQGIYDGKRLQMLEPVIITFLEATAPVRSDTVGLETVAGCLKWTGKAKTLKEMDAAIARGAKEHGHGRG